MNPFVGDFPRRKVVSSWKIVNRICDRKSVLHWLQQKQKTKKKNNYFGYFNLKLKLKSRKIRIDSDFTKLQNV